MPSVPSRPVSRLPVRRLARPALPRRAGLALLLAAALAPTGAAQFVSAQLRPSDGTFSDAFGYSVAVDGEVVVVGARAHDHVANNAGAAYVFRQAGTGWVQEAELLASDGAFQDVLGWSVDVDGDVVVAGAWQNGDKGIWAGSAYVFRWDGAAWGEEALLLAADGGAQDELGWSVAVSGGVVVVGAHVDDGNGADSGSAYVFRHDGAGGWSQEQKLLPGDGGAGDSFGEFVDVDGDVVLVGAPFDDDAGTDAGAAYVFRWDGAAWIEEAKLVPADGAGGERVGTAGVVTGDVVALGAPTDDDLGDFSGSAYVFRRDGASWSAEQKLLASDGAMSTFGAGFGSALDAVGDVILVGAPLMANGANPVAGAVYEFRWDGATWTETRKLTLPIDGSERLGTDVALSGDVAALGCQAGSFGIERSYVWLLNWADLGSALAGAGGAPRLAGAGSLRSGEPFSLAVSDARASAPAWFIAGFDRVDAPFKGGTLVPDPAPPALVLPTATDASGAVEVSEPWPAGIPAGFTIYCQVWIEDPTGPEGFAATNALSAVAP